MSISVEYENEFDRVVENYEKTDFYSKRLCPDQYVGLISDLAQNYYSRSEENNIFDYSQASLTINKKIQLPDNNFLLILESSHIAEYYEQVKRKIYGKKRPSPAPAMGRFPGETGYNIVNFLPKVFVHSPISIKDYNLIILNAIPFQCSLGSVPTKNRNKVFKRIWDDFGYDLLHNRLTILWSILRESQKKVFIVNACTAMAGQKKNIQNAIKAVVGYEVLQLYHPSYNWSAKLKKQQNLIEEYFKKYPR